VFYHEFCWWRDAPAYGRWGDLDGGGDGPVVWFACECGARIARRVDDGDVLDLKG
jgi:hypothetical protein